MDIYIYIYIDNKKDYRKRYLYLFLVMTCLGILDNDWITIVLSLILKIYVVDYFN